MRDKNIRRKDYITRTIVIIIEKYQLNIKFKFIKYELFNEELEK